MYEFVQQALKIEDFCVFENEFVDFEIRSLKG